MNGSKICENIEYDGIVAKADDKSATIKLFHIQHVQDAMQRVCMMSDKKEKDIIVPEMRGSAW